MAKVGIISGSALDHNPRVFKEASTLAQAGYDVTVLGAERDAQQRESDVAWATQNEFRFVPVGASNAKTSQRVIGRLARTLHATTGIETRFQLGGHPGQLLREARALKADVYLVHYEAALWAGTQLLRDGHRVGADFEDWYSEDLLPENRKKRPLRLLKSLEAELLQKGCCSSCPSAAMASALAETYHAPTPAVVYNAFPWSDRKAMDGQSKDRRDSGVPSIHWYSQTLGYGRGLEDLLAALPFLRHDAEIHLRGTRAEGFEAWLQARVPASWRKRIFLHDLVSNEELLSRIAEHDIGFSGEMTYCLSRDLTVTNKILHYLLAGLAVVASDTSGQREVARQAPGGVSLYPSGNPEALAEELNQLLASPEKLKVARTAALAAAEKTFCWERQAEVMLAQVRKALA